jgi:hypothetical protein
MRVKQSSSTKKQNDNIENEKTQTNADAQSYDQLAQQTLDLWREQLAHFLNNPEAMHEFNKIVEPASQLLTQGLDIWLAMAEQFGKTAQQTNAKGTDEPATERNDTDRASPAAALSGAGTYAVAELTRRLADLEKRFSEYERKPAPPRVAGKRKTASKTDDGVAGTAPKRRRKI